MHAHTRSTDCVHIPPTELPASYAGQGEQLPQISRFQAVVVGTDVYLHTHRSQRDILRLSTAAADGRLTMESLPIAPPSSGPPSRGLHSVTAIGSTLWIFGGAISYFPSFLHASMPVPGQQSSQASRSSCCQAMGSSHKMMGRSSD